VALLVDEVHGVERPSGKVVLARQIVPGLENFQGLTHFEDGLVVIHDLEKFLSLEEESCLDEAMRQEATRVW
jgi:purine-binding chemotaxis protein CheW